ncbi:MAG: hypothetical protein K2G03_01470 [Bacilli bacterium]|nr:hypothetical protein [Bacilli bacterium]
MINALLQAVFSLVIGLVNVLLTPIDLLIDKFLPDLGNALDMFNAFIDYILDYVSWAVGWTFLNGEVISLVVAYFTFKYTVPPLVSTIKLAIKWFEKLKL